MWRNTLLSTQQAKCAFTTSQCSQYHPSPFTHSHHNTAQQRTQAPVNHLPIGFDPDATSVILWNFLRLSPHNVIKNTKLYILETFLQPKFSPTSSTSKTHIKTHKELLKLTKQPNNWLLLDVFLFTSSYSCALAFNFSIVSMLVLFALLKIAIFIPPYNIFNVFQCFLSVLYIEKSLLARRSTWIMPQMPNKPNRRRKKCSYHMSKN